MVAKCRLLSFVIVIMTVNLFYSFVLADCVGMSKFQKGYSETESCMFLNAEDRSKAQVILSNNYQLFWQLMQNISHP